MLSNSLSRKKCLILSSPPSLIMLTYYILTPTWWWTVKVKRLSSWDPPSNKSAYIRSGGMFGKITSIRCHNFSCSDIFQESVYYLPRNLRNHTRFSPPLAELVFLSILLPKCVFYLFLLLHSGCYCSSSSFYAWIVTIKSMYPLYHRKSNRYNLQIRL